MARTYRPWTQAEDELVRQLDEQDWTDEQIAKHTGRTQTSISSRLRKLRQIPQEISVPVPAPVSAPIEPAKVFNPKKAWLIAMLIVAQRNT